MPASVRIAGMDPAIISRIAHDLGLPESSVASTTALFEKGATAPFIVRYRKEQTENLDDAKVRAVEERLGYYREVLDRRASLVKALIDQKKLTDELRQRIDGIYTKVELEDLFHLYKPRRKTRAAEAQEKGLEPLAEYIWNQEPDAWSLEVHAEAYKDPEKQVPSAELALQGALDIVAEWISENLEIRAGLREMLCKEGNLVSTVVPAKASQKTKYTMYYDRREPVTTIPSHRVLAIRRGTKEGVLASAIECDQTKAIDFILSSVIRDKESIFAPLLERAVRDAYSRILRPLIETEVRAMLKERADREAIRVFQENLSNLLLTPPAGAMVVMGIDISKGDECRLAVVDEKGNLLEEAAISLRQPRSTPAVTPEAQPSEPAPAEAAKVEAVLTDSASLPELEIRVSEAEPGELPETTPLATVVSVEAAAVAENVADEIAASPTAVLSDGEKPSLVSPEEPDSHDEFSEVSHPRLDSGDTAEESQAQAASEPAPVQVVEGLTADLQIAPETVELTPVAAAMEIETAPASEAPVVEVAAEPTASAEAIAAAPESGREPAAIGEAELRQIESAGPADSSPAEPQAISAEVPKPVAAKPYLRANDIEASRVLLLELLARHSVRAIAIGSSPGARNLEMLLRQILADEKMENVLIAAVNDAGVAIYASSRVAREELPDSNVSARCAVSLARRLQDPLAELVKIDPKLIGVGQYQHDVDQKELHRGLLQIVRSCVNRVALDPNVAGYPLLRHIAGFNDKLARKLVAARNTNGPFRSRAALLTVPGVDQAVFEQAAGFLRIRDGENPLDRTAVHPESYPVVEKMAASLGVGIGDLIGNRDLISKLRVEDFISESVGPLTLHDIREELLRPGRDPRRTFAIPKFRADVREIGDLKEGMALEGTVTNVTNFGAFVDIGVRQDGLVHLSQMSNRFIRDPREAVKVGDVVQVKVISVEVETKRIGLSIKALLPTLQRKRKKPLHRGPRSGGATPPRGLHPGAEAQTSEAGPAEQATVEGEATQTAAPRGSENARRPGPVRRPPHRRNGRRRDGRRPPRQALTAQDAVADPKPAVPEEPKGPEPTLQEKIALLQSKFRGIH